MITNCDRLWQCDDAGFRYNINVDEQSRKTQSTAIN